MTNIQAADLLKGLEQSLDDYCELNDEGKAAFRMAITALESFGISEQLPSAQPENKEYVKTIPSAQSEIVRCRDCKHYYFADNRIPQEQRYVCDLDGDRWKPDDYCSFAERMKGGGQE